MPLQYQIFPVTPFQQNCSLIWCDETMQGALIDPGGESQFLLAQLKEREITLVKIILTHGHLDHVGGADEIRVSSGVPVIGPSEQDRFWFDSLSNQSEMFGFTRIEPFLPDRWLTEGDRVEIGKERLEVIHTPGHTPGHVVLFHEQSRIAFVGDVLFQGSVGRSDFPMGNHSQLIDSIKNKLLPLGDDVVFIPGHGPQSTFGHEKENNPYL